MPGTKPSNELEILRVPSSLNSPQHGYPLHTSVSGMGGQNQTLWGGFHVTQLHGHHAAKSLQSCPTLCDPIGGSPPGSLVHGILQARTLEWVAIAFFSAGK